MSYVFICTRSFLLTFAVCQDSNCQCTFISILVLHTSHHVPKTYVHVFHVTAQLKDVHPFCGCLCLTVGKAAHAPIKITPQHRFLFVFLSWHGVATSAFHRSTMRLANDVVVMFMCIFSALEMNEFDYHETDLVLHCAPMTVHFTFILNNNVLTQWYASKIVVYCVSISKFKSPF